MATEEPYYIYPLSKFIDAIKDKPKTKIYFITIKDNSQGPKWTRLGKAIDWIRRKTSLYYIVRGMEGGIHFHILAYVPSGNFTIPRGIHLNIRPLDKTTKLTMSDIEDIDKAEYYRSKQKDRMVLKYRIPIECTTCANMIARYWRLKKAKEDRSSKKQRKNDNIGRIIDYMDRNHRENAPDDVAEYTTYSVKYM